MADLESYEVVDKFTQCAKCKQVLTEKVFCRVIKLG